MKDISCYRDMIIGTWIEQTMDGQKIETNHKSVHVFSVLDKKTTIHLVDDGYNTRTISFSDFGYIVNCYLITSSGVYYEGDQMATHFREEKIVRFNDSLLKVNVLEESGGASLMGLLNREIEYKKVSKANKNAISIQCLWEMTQSNNPSIVPFRIKFQADGSYLFYTQAIKSEEVIDEWELFEDEGKYVVYDSFLITSFFDNPTFGLPQKNDVACWDISFIFKEDDDGKGNMVSLLTSMIWSAFENSDGQLVEKYFLFSLIPPPAE